MPELNMDSKLNMHLTFPVIAASDFIMYGKTMLMKETGILNENICNNLLFSMESIYCNCLKSYGYYNFWKNDVNKQSWNISAKVAGQIWENRNILDPIGKADVNIHMSNIIWRRTVEEEEDGNVVSLGVYPDINVIPEHNFLIGETADIILNMDPKMEESLGYLTEDDEAHLDARGYYIYYYYKPLPAIVLKGDPDSPEYYDNFYNQCDKNIYHWMERLMSALMLTSADAVFAARDIAYISLIEGMPDESSFPFGDVFQTEDQTPIVKLCTNIEGLSEQSLYPNRVIWTAAQCERYLPEEVQKHIEESALHYKEHKTSGSLCMEDSVNKIVQESLISGHISGLDEHWNDSTSLCIGEGYPLNTLVDQIDPETKDITEKNIKACKERIVQTIASQSMWGLPKCRLNNESIVDIKSVVNTEKDVNKIKKDIILDKAFIQDIEVKPMKEQNNSKDISNLDKAFQEIETDSSSKEPVKNINNDILDKAFKEPTEPIKKNKATAEEINKIFAGLNKPKKSTLDKLDMAFVDVSLPNKKPITVATEFAKVKKHTNVISNILDSAFIDSEIE